MLVAYFQSVCTLDLVVGAGLLHLEAGSIDEDIDLVLLAVKHGSFFGNLVDALAVSVDQMDVRTVEGG
jgi:hypothetical protein